MSVGLNRAHYMTFLFKNIIRLVVSIGCGVTILSGCTESTNPTDISSSGSQKSVTSFPRFSESVVWAINVGGDEYLGNDGILYQQDKLTLSSNKGETKEILGSQDPLLFRSFRQGNLSLEHAVPNGTYSLTLKFAEPENIAVGKRVFDVMVEQKKVIESLDIKGARDGKHHSALVQTIANIVIEDGELNLALNGVIGEPVLHALILRKQVVDSAKWQLIWQDEFDYNGAPDDKKWNFDEWPSRKVNDEDQAYTSRLKNARVEDGRLVIEAHKEQYDGAQYTSARLHTLGKADFLYGKVDVRAKIAAGQGTWSAIWMLPSDPFKYASNCQTGDDWQGSSTCDAWPNSGEIDIMEHVGYDMQKIHGTVHTKAYYWVNWQQRKASIKGNAVEHEFHTYSVEWSPEYIIVSYDHIPYFFYRNESTDWQSCPFDHPYHLILNLAIGGAWGPAGGPIDDAIFPVRMEVDYVRIYQSVEDTKS